ncbi:BRO-N domain-containing protein [Psychrobacter sp. UBA6291]|uniref:BRO-N domain-containing protein n=1 Tax=Psychrobacter sp. UBA6291 TaxID=1947357 RepID=UPI00257BE310|nr:BRO family protein [Psychrobacter sp. UBA6291]
MNTLTFNGNTLTTINQANQIWLTSADVAKALGYKSTRSLTNLYNANSDEFSANMTEVIESVTSSKTKGLKVKTRIFSLRGCHLLAMFARTDIAKAFRVWVLDILDRETKTTPRQRTPLRQACDRLAVGNMLVSDAYKLVSNHYNVEHIDQIPEASLPEAVAFVYNMILMKQQASAKNTQYVNDMYAIGSKRVEETRHAIGVIKKALASLDCGIEVVRQHNETQFSVFEGLKSQTTREVR